MIFFPLGDKAFQEEGMKETGTAAAIVALTVQTTVFMMTVPQFVHFPSAGANKEMALSQGLLSLCSGFTSCSSSRVGMLMSGGANSSQWWGRWGGGGAGTLVFLPLNYNFPISSQKRQDVPLL